MIKYVLVFSFCTKVNISGDIFFYFHPQFNHENKCNCDTPSKDCKLSTPCFLRHNLGHVLREASIATIESEKLRDKVLQLNCAHCVYGHPFGILALFNRVISEL